MTYEEAINLIDNLIGMIDDSQENDYDKAFNVAIECIEKQILKKPKNATGYYRDNKCPSCGKPIKSGKGSSSHYRNDWCNRCGQAIDWSDEE